MNITLPQYTSIVGVYLCVAMCRYSQQAIEKRTKQAIITSVNDNK